MRPRPWQLACRTQTKRLTFPASAKWPVALRAHGAGAEEEKRSLLWLFIGLVMVGHNELWWGYVWNSMQVKIPIRTAVVGWLHSQLWSNVGTVWWWRSHWVACICVRAWIGVMFLCLALCLCASLLWGCLRIVCKSIFVYLSGREGRLSVLSPCLQVMNTWLNGSVTNDVTLTDTCTQGRTFPFLAWCLNYDDMMSTPVRPSCCRSTAVYSFVSFKNDIY